MPCTAEGRNEGGICGIHWHRDNPILITRFNHDQAIYRDAWNGIALGTHQIDVERQRVVRIEVAIRAVVAAPIVPCIAIKKNGVRCSKNGTHLDGLCGQHHGIAQRQLEDAPMKAVRREMRRMYRVHATAAELDAYVAANVDGLVLRARRDIMFELDQLVLRSFNTIMEQHVYQNRATEEQMNAVLAGWREQGLLNDHRQAIMQIRLNAAFQRREWLDGLPVAPAPVRYTAAQREAQLAADTQNVHTMEISRQMNDSLKILLAVEIPVGQQTTVNEIVDSWRAKGYLETEIHQVRADVVRWWNHKQIYVPDDKLYKRALRGLWWTIKSYTGELRGELEKRLWDECKDAALPYSVCTQGHLARLSNVMAGFDDAFVPPVPVGEILQQKMAAISGMDVPYERQIELAEEVLAELKIPATEHANWLAAF